MLQRAKHKCPCSIITTTTATKHAERTKPEFKPTKKLAHTVQRKYKHFDLLLI